MPKTCYLTTTTTMTMTRASVDLIFHFLFPAFLRSTSTHNYVNINNKTPVKMASTAAAATTNGHSGTINGKLHTSETNGPESDPGN